MKIIKKKYIFPFFILFIIFSQMYTFGGKTFFENKNTGNPYILSDGYSFETIPESFGLDDAIFELTVYDNDTNDFYNYVSSYPSDLLLTFSDGTSERATFLSNQSDVANHKYRFSSSIINDNISYWYLREFNLAMNASTNSIVDYIEVTAGAPDGLNISSADATFNEPIEYPGYPIIANFNSEESAPEEAFSIDEITENSVTFTFESYGLDQSFPTSFETTMKDNGVSDPMLDTKPYTANLVKTSTSPPGGGTGNYVGQFYTYEITGLQPSSYTIVSFANSGMSLGNTTSSIFDPDSDIDLVSELNYDQAELTFSMSETPYITSTSFQIIDSSASASSIQFSMQITDNAGNDFYNNLVANSKQIAITLINVTNGNQSLNTTATWIDTTKPVDGIYTFQINDLNENNDYQIYSLDNTGLAIDYSYWFPDNEILVNEELGVTDNSFTTLSDNPYIQTDSFEITNVTDTFVEFQITVVNDIEGSFIPENNINVTLNDSTGTAHQTIGVYQSTSGNTYTYEITEIEAGAPLIPGESYQIISLDNTGLAVDGSTSIIDDQILIVDDLGEDGNFTIIGNPYIENGSFAIIETTKISVEFQIKVNNNSNNDFIPQNDLNVTLKDSQGVDHQTTAHYVRTDAVDPNIYVYEITELESGDPLTLGENYQIISLNDTGLAVGEDSNAIDDEILITDDLGGDGSFTTIGNPYIESGSFAIVEETKTSMKFEITINNNINNEFIYGNDLEVTIKDDIQIVHQTTAHYVSNVDNTYTYEITEESPGVPLNPGTNYEIVSLNNTGLAVGEDSNAIDDEILIVDDLGEDGNFTTIGNPYIETDSFMITSTTKSSVQFKLTVSNNSSNEFVPGSSLSVKIKTDDQTIHQTTANYISADGSDSNTYIYEITELETGIPLGIGENYEIVSLNNTGLAVGENSNAIDDEILIVDDLGEDGSFTTIGNPYIETDSFSVINTTTNSVEFKLKITDNELNEFDEENPISVTLKDSSGNLHSSTAKYIRTDNTDLNTFYYEITELESDILFTPGESYDIYSLNNTGLTISENSNAIDDEILIVDDLGSDGHFNISEISYIHSQGFEILSSTPTSVKFQLKIEDVAGTFNNKDPLNVTLKDVTAGGTTFSRDANFVSEESENNLYVYEVDGLERNKDYQFVSLNDINLSIDGEISVYEDIDLVNDLEMNESDLSFDTIENPYIDSTSGFEIVQGSETSTSIQYSILAYNWESLHQETMQVKMLNQTTGNVDLHSANLIKIDGDNYIYEVDDLNSKTSYQFISLIDTGLAVGNEDAIIQSEINLKDDLGIASEEITFATKETFFQNYSFLILSLIILIFLVLIVMVYILYRMKVKKNKGKKLFSSVEF